MNNTVSNCDHRPFTAMSVLLSRIERELRDLASMSDDLQAVISPALSSDKPQSNDLVPAVQALDQMSQTLHAMATFMETVAASVPAHWAIDPRAAALALPLAALAARLDQHHDTSATARLGSGDYEHF